MTGSLCSMMHPENSKPPDNKDETGIKLIYIYLGGRCAWFNAG
jgi:hypothetical protein